MLNGLFPSALLTIHKGQSGGRGLSPRLWARVGRYQSLSPDGFSNGFYVGDDFLRFADWSPASAGTTTLPSTTVPGVNGYAVYTDTTTTAASIVRLNNASGGVVRLGTSATDNHQAVLCTEGVYGAISDAAGSDKLTVFEARVRFGQIAEHGAFIGLTEEGLNANDTLVDDTGALPSKDLIGFHVDTAGPTALDFVYRKAGQTAQVVIAGVQTIAADTWYKLGFVYDPSAPDSKKIAVYVDNVEQSTYVTATDIAAATFPDGEELGFLATVKTGEAGSKTLDLDWHNFFQAG